MFSNGINRAKECVILLQLCIAHKKLEYITVPLNCVPPSWYMYTSPVQATQS